MASRYYFGAILAATLASAAASSTAANEHEFAPAEVADHIEEQRERELHQGHQIGWGHDGWANDGWSPSSSSSSSSSSSTSGKSGKSGGSGSGSGKSGKSGGSDSSTSSDDSHGHNHGHGHGHSHGHGHGHGHHWGAPPSWHGGWPAPESSSSSSSSSGKSGKSGGSGSGKSGKSGGSGSSSSSSSVDHPGWGGHGGGHHGHGHGGWGGHGGHWNEGWSPSSSSSSSSSSGKSGKSGGGGSSKGSKGGSDSDSSSTSSHDHDGWHSGSGGWGGTPAWQHGGWGGPPKPPSGKAGKSDGGGGKSGKSDGGKSGKSKGSKGGDDSSSSSSSADGGGHWVWVGGGEYDHSHGGWDGDGWSASIDSSTSISTSGKSGKSGGGSDSSSVSGSGSGSGKSGKGSSSGSGSESVDNGKWTDDGSQADDWVAPTDPIYSHGGSVGGWKSDGWDNDGHYQADISYVRSEVTRLIKESHRQLIPKFLRLGFHDCVGGCDGCVDMTNPENKGLTEPIDAIYPIVKKFASDYSRADVWAMATLVSADLSVTNGRPHGYHFPMRYIGRKDCSGANAKGVGGPEVNMPSNDLTTHGLLDFFEEYFGFDADETVTIMGVHSVAVAHRENSGYGSKGKDKKDGWVFDAEDYVLNNRYYAMLVGEDEDEVHSAPQWHMELVQNEEFDGVPDRYQWYHEKEGTEERPIMTNADMALVRDLSDHMYTDANGNEGAVDCTFKDENGGESGGYTRRRKLQKKKSVACPVASHTMEKMVEYKLDNELFLYDFEKVLEKMVKNGY